MDSFQELQTEAARLSTTDLLTVDQLKSAWLDARPVTFGDPVLSRARFPLSRTLYPLGFPVTVSTNCEEVLEAAQACWGSFSQLFNTPPARIEIGVTDTESLECPPPPVGRVRDHLTINIADSENFIICDYSLGYALVWVNTAALRHSDYFRYFFVDCAGMCLVSAGFATGIHAGCVALDGAGVLLCGDSGAGKSTLSWACARSGWTYITDDGSYLVLGGPDRLVVGNSGQVRFRPSAAQLFPELRGCAVMQRAGIGKPSVEWPTAGAPETKASATANIRHIVFLNRNTRKRELAAFPTAVARLYMLQRVQCSPWQAERHTAAVDDLLELGAHELCYDDLDWAVERLAQLVREGR
jgi:hypothetical protein